MPRLLRRAALSRLAVILLAMFAHSLTAAAETTAFRQAVAGAASSDDALSGFYEARGYTGLWTGLDARTRRNAFMQSLSQAGDHGLPAARFDPERVIAQINAAQTEAQKGAMDVELSRLFLSYARAVQTGVLNPRQEVAAIKREVPLRSRASLIEAFAQSAPGAFLRSLPPSSPEYARLLREKLQLEITLANRGWGASVPAGRLDPGASGARVVRLRDRLIAMGYMAPTASQAYDAGLQAAVQRAQTALGLAVDGVAGDATIAALNVTPEERLASIIVAMERERWINMPRGERHIWVNLTDFSASIIDDGRTTFTSRTVIGAHKDNRESPEFSDEMEFMVINPSWYVPRSIITREYLPMLKRNANAVSHIQITDRRGRVVPRSSINFASYSERTFPYAMRQPPSNGNALGLVKFIFPNQYNIYLHDTPSKSLFNRQVRAFSHGCIRLGDPFGFAHALLARQTSDPEGFFQERLRTGREARVNLEEPVPVHLVYRTAFTHTNGELNFRPDVYGRDRAIWNALVREGVQIRARRS